VLGADHLVLDPSRVAAQVASGIGFLGAGTIILRRKIVHGLTTAASIWSVAAVGLAVGGGLYVAATGATAIMILILAGMRPVERRLFAQAKAQSVVLQVKNWTTVVPELRTICDNSGVVVQTLKIEARSEQETATLELTVAGSMPKLMSALDGFRAHSEVRLIRAVLNQP
jgi:putative Mg2+ transporter-C (MgtC) family protein